MWIFTKIGFFSIVQDAEHSDVLMVRSRIKKDLVRLIVQFKIPEKIIESKKSDYPFRIFVSKELVSVIMAQTVNDIDYCNFKNEIALDEIDNVPVLQRNRLTLYHKVWEIMRKLK